MFIFRLNWNWCWYYYGGHGHGQYGSYGYEGVGYEVGSHGRRVYGDASFNNDDGRDGHGSSRMLYICYKKWY